MMKRVFCLLMLACGFVLSLQAAPDKKKGSVTTPSAVVYALPQTVLDVEVIAEKTILKRGPFAEYAEKFLGITEDVVKADGQQWRIEALTLDSHADVDPQQFHKIVTAGDYDPNLINLTPQGLIRGFNMKTSRTKEMNYSQVSVQKEKEVRIEYGLFGIDPLLEERNDTTYRVIETDTAFVKVPVLETQYEAKTLEEKAAEAAHQIFKLRKRRFKILTANFEVLPPDGKAYEIIVKELAKLEHEYISLFVGKRVSVKRVFNFSYTPKKGEGSGVLFRYSQASGIVPTRDLSGRPVMIEMEDLKVTRNVETQTTVESATGNNKIVYRIPGQAHIKVVNGKKVLLDKKIVVTQYGKVASMPTDVLFNEGLSIEFHPELGSIKNISE